MSNQKLENLVEKIDVLSEKVNSDSNYTVEIKQKYNYILGALKELAEEKVNNTELDLDGLFE